MADEEETAVADGEAEEAPVKRKIPLLFVIIGAAVLLIAIAAVAGVLLLGKKTPPEPAAKHEAGPSMEFGGHIDNADENAQRAAALARAAADGAAPATNAAGPKP